MGFLIIHFFPPKSECMDQDTIDILHGPAEHKEHVAPAYPIAHRDLAESLVAKGQLAMVNGDLQEGLHYFEEAIKIESKCAKLHYAQGLSLFEYGEKHGQMKILLAASKKFKIATTLAPDFFEAWQAWGSVLLKLGKNYDEHHYFQEAQKKILRAIALVSTESAETITDLYWELGVLFMHLAENSGEALDLHQAIHAFHQAHSHCSQLPADFWKDYASACYQFALQINDTHFLIKASSFLKNALALAPNAYDIWRLFAHVFQSLYFKTYDDEDFTKTNDAYAVAAKCQPHRGSSWVEWAEFLCLSSRHTLDTEQLHSCVEKCQRAFSCDPDNVYVQAIWAEALASLGGETEKLDTLYDAQNRIIQALEKTEQLPSLWFAYGVVLREFGYYFHDLDYYAEAIEKFQTGLSIDRTCHAHWHAIGELYALLAELGGEPEDLEQSLRFFHKAIDLHPSPHYIINYAIALSKLGEMTREQHWVEKALLQFERALSLSLSQRKNAQSPLHPDWLFHYACCLDTLGDFHEEDTHYLRAIEIFSHVLMIDPELYAAHHRLALTLSHLGELTAETEHFHRALRHLHVCARHDPENDCIILDYATVLIHMGHHSCDTTEAQQLYRDAEQQLWNAIRLGNAQGYYYLACLYSLLGQCEKAMAWMYRAAHFDILPPLDEILQDEWLENLRATGECIIFLSRLEQRGNLSEER